MASSKHAYPRRPSFTIFILASVIAILAVPLSSLGVSLWSNSAVPATASFADNNAYEIGVKFTSDVSGYVTGIRFYKGSGNTGTHIGHLWTNTGTLLASATFTNETASGWQQVSFAQPVLISANTVYVASYWDPKGNYALTRPYFTTEYNNAPLHALADGAAGPNGAYLWNGSGLPNSGYDASNYWVDIVFVPATQTSLWSNSTVPATASFSDNNAYEIGLKFTSDVSGYVTGIRFYKGSGNTGTHIGHLWTTTGKLLASATFTNETASGWQQVSFAQPVLIAANTVYVASYWDPTGNYALTRPYFTAEYNNAPLHALADGAAGPNGAYLWNSSGLPNSGYGSSNYWVDVKFSPLPAATLLGTPDATISSISPTSGPLSGGTLVTIDGAGFESGTAVSFGGANASSVAVISSTQLTAVTPAGPEGAVNVTATDPGSEDGSLADGFMYLSDPTVSGVSPSSGLTTGGTTVTISGSGFQSGAMVVFGAILAASVTVMSPTQIQAVTPAESAGSVGITITNPDAGTASLPSAFAFAPLGGTAPSLGSVSPNSNISTGGATVSINGANFVQGSTVQFGTTAATSVTFINSEQLRAVVPPGTAETTVSLTVTNPGGLSARLTNGFFYGKILFQDGFESGNLNAWDQPVVCNGSGATSVTSLLSHSGTYSARQNYTLPAVTASADNDCYMATNVSLSHFFLRGWVYLVPFTPSNQSTQMKLFYVMQQPSPAAFDCVLTTFNYELAVQCGATQGQNPVSLAYGPSISTNQWNEVELEAQLNTAGQYNGWFNVWLNGSLAISRQDADIRDDVLKSEASQNFDYFVVGQQLDDSGPAAETETRYWDDIVIADAYIP